jgi:hypothetical protein
MTAFLKIYTDSAHTNEVAHTANVSTTLNNGGTLASGATVIPCTTTTGMPAQGQIDIDSGGNLETILYTSISGNNLNLAKPTALSHANGVAVVQWYYQLAVGDQVNGIINDGTNASPNTNNTATWYLYNAGDQTATSIAIQTASSSPSTTDGYSDTLISITSASTGFAASVSPANLAAGSQQQFWVTEEIPSGQSANGANPQVCVVNIYYQSV